MPTTIQYRHKCTLVRKHMPMFHEVAGLSVTSFASECMGLVGVPTL
uniref:Uncharacterized protein n=1 Tax=Setaria italica TaxID=4555 RepID=K3XU27_SETIT